MIKIFKIKKFRRINSGFTLVETLVAISIFSMSILGLLSVLASGITNTTYAKEKIIADYLAQEGIESIRNMRDSFVLYPANGNWNSFKAELAPCTSNIGCGFDNSLSKMNQNFIFSCSNPNHPQVCKLYLNNGNYNADLTGVDSGFVRKVWATTISADEIEIFSEVDWKQGSGNYKIIFSEDLFNWTE